MSKVSGQFSTLVKIAGATLAVNTTQYADNDLVGTLMTVNCGKSGILQTMTLHDLDVQAAALEVLVFSDYPGSTTFTNNSALDIADSDLPKICGVFSAAASDYIAQADNTVGMVRGLAIPFYCGDGKNLYIAFRSAAATPTYSASGLSVTFGFLMDGE